MPYKHAHSHTECCSWCYSDYALQSSPMWCHYYQKEKTACDAFAAEHAAFSVTPFALGVYDHHPQTSLSVAVALLPLYPCLWHRCWTMSSFSLQPCTYLSRLQTSSLSDVGFTPTGRWLAVC